MILTLPNYFPRYDIFISFSTKDRKFANRLYEILLAQYRISPWFSSIKFKDGIIDFVVQDINEAIKQSNYCIAIFSKNAIKSKWFFIEMGAFFAKEMIGQRMIIPVLHDISYRDFVLNFPIFADRFVIMDMNTEAMAAQISKFIRTEQSSLKNEIFDKVQQSKKKIFSVYQFDLSFDNIISSIKNTLIEKNLWVFWYNEKGEICNFQRYRNHTESDEITDPYLLPTNISLENFSVNQETKKKGIKLDFTNIISRLQRTIL